MLKKSITIIGGGNLGISITNGLLKAAYVSPENITVTRRNLQAIISLKEKGINLTSDNCQAVKNSDIIFIAVKPQQVAGVLKEISAVLDPSRHIIISLVAGMSLEKTENLIGINNITLFHAIPNTAIAVQESMTCIASKNESEEQKKEVSGIFNQLGKVMFIDEELMGAATVLGSCGTAFALRFIRAAAEGGVQMGFEADIAHFIAAQTLKGAASLVLENNSHPEAEIDKVTTPKGITITGLNEMEHQGLSSSVISGIMAAFNKMEQSKK
ncbi:MAG: pyrroline-5-carboxylate reductase [Bacteroidota bacterium]|nr:pyrroline-5-carboxylate reductase [Bacteroidota bacterium]MDP4273067.1 pyrroline-5-carboxylate reductase [Bacteroidota bacterium]